MLLAATPIKVQRLHGRIGAGNAITSFGGLSNGSVMRIFDVSRMNLFEQLVYGEFRFLFTFTFAFTFAAE